MDALILDFDGVVVDSEPVHLACFQEVLAGVGVELTRDDYYTKYLGFDDHDCMLAAGRDRGVTLDDGQIAALIAAKTALVQQHFSQSVEPLGGAVELIRAVAAAAVPVAVCSGALRKEIELASAAVGAGGHFAVIVSAEDVSAGKPDPEGYRLAAERLSAKLGRPVAPGRCVVVEDSPAGIEAAHSAGMRVLAVTNSYQPDQLRSAEAVVASLTEVSLESLQRLL